MKPHRHHQGESTANLQWQSSSPIPPLDAESSSHLSGTQTKAEEAWPTRKNDASQQTK